MPQRLLLVFRGIKCQAEYNTAEKAIGFAASIPWALPGRSREE